MLTLARLENEPGPAETDRFAAKSACSIVECVRKSSNNSETVAAFRGVRIAVTEMAG